MFSRNLRKSLVWRIPSINKSQSTGSHDNLLVDINDKNGISTLTLNQKPVNCLTLDLLKNMCEKLDLLEKEKVKGLILTSVNFNYIFYELMWLNIFISVLEKCFLFWS